MRHLEEDYRGWECCTYRVGFGSCNYAASATVPTNPGMYLKTTPFGGRGAMRRAMDTVKKMIDVEEGK